MIDALIHLCPIFYRLLYRQLMEILNSDEYPDIITWLPHECGFAILNKKRFSNEVLPKYFKESKYTSFTRRMNRWRFTIQTHGHQKSSYFHPKFVRNDPELCHGMVPSPQTCYLQKTKKGDSGHGLTKQALPTTMMSTVDAFHKKASSPPSMHDAQRMTYPGNPISGLHIPAINSSSDFSDDATKGSTYAYPQNVAIHRDQQEQAFTYPQIHMQNRSYSTNLDCNTSIEWLYDECQANRTQEMMMSNTVSLTPNFAHSNMMSEYAGYGGGAHYQQQYPMMPTSSRGQRSSHLFSQDEQQVMPSMQNYTFATRSSQYYSASNGALSGNNTKYPYQNQMY